MGFNEKFELKFRDPGRRRHIGGPEFSKVSWDRISREGVPAPRGFPEVPGIPEGLAGSVDTPHVRRRAHI